ncbi:MAG: SRPBCC family protein [Flavobacteriaceae bacterium]
MKAVKIIVTFLVILTVIFFGTGLVIKESSYSVEISINKSLEETFASFNDVSTIKEWIPQYKSIEIVDKKAGVTGSVYNIVVEHNKQEVIVKERIMGYVENEKVTLFFDREGVEEIDDYTFKRDGSKTIITLNSNYQAKSYILGCVLPYFKGTFKEVDVEALNNFKAFIEK